MDIHSALSALMRPMALPAHPMPASTMAQLGLTFPTSLLALTNLDQPIFAQTPDLNPSTPKKARMEDSCSPVSSSVSSSSPLHSPRRKLPQPIPEEKKDIAYYERRRKNNDAAKRSRDARRQKEEATSRRAQQLEQENAQLRGQLALLKSEMANIQILLLTARNPAVPAVKPSAEEILQV